MSELFYCQTHAADLPVEEQSDDPRYCLSCYNFLVKETRMLEERGTTKRPEWIPNPLPEALRTSLQQTRDTGKGVTKAITLISGMSQPVTTTPRQETSLNDAIIGLAGLSSRAIAEQLSLQGFNISYRTVARRMKRVKV